LLDHYAVAPLHEADAARAQAERTEEAAGQVVDAARAHGEQRRSARVEVDDRGAEADGLRLPRQHSEHGEGVLPRLLGGAEGRVAELLRALHPGDQLLPGEVPRVAGEAEFSSSPARIQSSYVVYYIW